MARLKDNPVIYQQTLTLLNEHEPYDSDKWLPIRQYVSEGSYHKRDMNNATRKRHEAAEIQLAKDRDKYVEYLHKCYPVHKIGALLHHGIDKVYLDIARLGLSYPVKYHWRVVNLGDNSVHYYRSSTEAAKAMHVPERWVLKQDDVGENQYKYSHGVWIEYDGTWHEIDS